MLPLSQAVDHQEVVFLPSPVRFLTDPLDPLPPSFGRIEMSFHPTGLPPPLKTERERPKKPSLETKFSCQMVVGGGVRRSLVRNILLSKGWGGSEILVLVRTFLA